MAAALTLLAQGTLLSAAPPVAAFGTTGSQGLEHQKITSAALRCFPNAGGSAKLAANECFQDLLSPGMNSLSALAGYGSPDAQCAAANLATGISIPFIDCQELGGVGNPDATMVLGYPQAHCDDADYLAPRFQLVTAYTIEAGQGDDPVKLRNASLRDCVEYLKSRFAQAANFAIGMLDSNGDRLDPIKSTIPEGGCQFGAGDTTGNAKCDALLAFGRLLHGAEDFYAHSNWADVADPNPNAPISLQNPPGLGAVPGVAPVPSPLLDMLSPTSSNLPDTDIPDDFTTGCFSVLEELPIQVPGFIGPCAGRVWHESLNKDEGLITVDPLSGALSTSCYSTPACTPRGAITVNGQSNFDRAVHAAVVEAERQWAELQVWLEELRPGHGQLLACALTHDNVQDCSAQQGPAPTCASKLTAPLKPGDVLFGSGIGTGGTIAVYHNEATGSNAAPASTLTDCNYKSGFGGMAFDGSGELLATDFQTDFVERYNSTTGAVMSNFGSPPAGVRTALTAQLSPSTVAVENAQGIVAGDHLTIGLYSPDAEPALVASVSGTEVTLASGLSQLHNAGEVVLDNTVNQTYYWCHPESLATDSQGNEYVGTADCLQYLLEFDKYGRPHKGFILRDPLDTTSTRGTDWITLAPGNDCTLYWTSEGRSVKRFNVCTGLPDPDLAIGLGGEAAYALRVLPDGEVLVADTDRVVRLSTQGVVLQQYPLSIGTVYGLDLDPDGKSFWVSTGDTGVIARIGMDSGAIEQLVTVPPGLVGQPATGGGLLVVPNTSIKATGIEVTQVLQNQANTDRLIAGKQTYAIVRAQTTGANEPATGVTATLQVSDMAGQPLKPLNGRVTLGGAPARDRLTDSFVFALPPGLNSGQMHLEATVNPDSDPLRYPAAAATVTSDVTFDPPPSTTFNLTVVDLSYATALQPFMVNTTASYEDIAGPVRRLYPISDAALQLDSGGTQGALAANRLLRSTLPFDPEAAPGDPNTCGRVLNWLIGLRAELQLQDNTILYGAISPASGQFSPYGQNVGAQPGGPAGCSYTKQPGFTSRLVATGAPDDSNVAVHEVGHSLGLNHTDSQDPTCVPLPPDQQQTDTYPDPNATIGLGSAYAAAHQGDASPIEDVGLDSLAVAQSRFDDAAIAGSYHDFMAYCPDPWMSDTRFEQLYQDIPNLNQGSPPPLIDPSGASLNALLVAGTINFVSDTAQVQSTMTGNLTGAFPAAPVGPYQLRLLNGNGTALASYSFAAVQTSGDVLHDQYPAPSGSFDLTVPLVTNMRGVEIFSAHSGRVIWSMPISPSRPALTVTSPKSGITLPTSGTFQVAWSATDADNKPLTYTVLFSADGGHTWLPQASNITTSNAMIDASQLPGATGNGVIRILASDGVNIGAAEVGSLTVPAKSPTAEIVAPLSLSTYTSAQAVELEGFASDPQDGALSGAQLSWTSSIDGPLGTGNVVVADALSVGVHTITLTATTPDGQTALTSTVVTVGPDTIRGPTLDVGPSTILVPVMPFGGVLDENVEVDNLGSGSPTWTATTDSPRIVIKNSDGQTPGHLGFVVDMSGGAFVAHIMVTAPGAAHSPQVVTITGQVVTAASVMPGDISYGTMVLGATPAARTVTLRNTGVTPLTVDSTVLTGGQSSDFTLSNNGCRDNTMPRGASCTVTVSFSPGGTGQRSAYLSLGDANSAARWYVSLTGEGVPQPTGGTLVAWGDNRYGAAGNSTNFQGCCPFAPDPAPTAVQGISNVAAVASGANHTLAVTADGTLWGWGSEYDGALGNLYTGGATYTPHKVWGMGNVASVAAAEIGFSVALKHDGTVWEWGDHCYDFSTGIGWLPPLQVNIPKIIAIAAGNDIRPSSTTYGDPGVDALAVDGTVWDWHAGGCGSAAVQVAGPNGPLTGIVAVAFRMALRNDGTVWTWGDGVQGQLGNGTLASSSIAVEVLDPSGSGPLTGVVAIASRSAQRYALKSDGTVVAWGSARGSSYYNDNGQTGVALGLGPNYTGVTQDLPAHVVGPGGNGDLSGIVAIQPQEALRNDGTVWTWGGNQAGELGIISTSITASSVPVQVAGVCGGATINGAFLIAAGYVDRLAIISQAGTASCPGGGGGGGGGTPPATPVSGKVARQPDNAGWYNHPIQIAWTDQAAGATCDPPTTYARPDGAGVGVTGYCTTPSGSVDSGALTFNYDETPPTTVANVAGTPLAPGYISPVTVTLHASDDASGVAGSFYTLDGDATIHTYTGPFSFMTPGYHRVNFWSQDNAGNVEPHQDSAHAALALVVKTPTSLTYTGPVATDYHDPIEVSAKLATSIGALQPVSAEPVTFNLGFEACTAQTDSTGTARCSITPGDPAGTEIVSTTFAGDAQYLPSDSESDFAVAAEEASIVYTGPILIANQQPVTLSASLLEDGSVPIPNAAVTLSIGSGTDAQQCTAATDLAGRATCTIASANQPLGPNIATALFAGDVHYRPASMSADTLVFATLARGTFAIGDENAAINNGVTFWGDRWVRDNSLSGGPTPDAFKGFADDITPSPTACGASWTTTGGNSPGPPQGPLPSYLAVIVISKATKSGTSIQGTAAEIVIIHTNPGYQSDPGHPGTATVVAVLCHS